MNYLNNLLYKIELLPYYGKVEGALKNEIVTLVTKESPYQFPDAYLEFLQIMGNRVPFLRGIDYQIHCLEELNQIGRCMVVNHNPELKLKKTDFVFFMSQGSAFAFFNLCEGENPPIYGFIENQNCNEPKIIARTFTEFLERRFAGDNPFGIITMKGEKGTDKKA